VIESYGGTKPKDVKKSLKQSVRASTRESLKEDEGLMENNEEGDKEKIQRAGS